MQMLEPVTSSNMSDSFKYIFHFFHYIFVSPRTFKVLLRKYTFQQLSM